MSSTTVWAFRPLPELKNQTGFVECDEALAKELIARGDAQDPRDGANALNEIEPLAPPELLRSPPAPHVDEDDDDDDEPEAGEYATKVLTPKPKPKPKRRR